MSCCPARTCVTDDYAGDYVEIERREHGRPLDWSRVVALLDPPPPPRPGALGRPGRGGGVAALARWVAAQVEGNRNRALFWAACRAADAGVRRPDELVEAACAAGLPSRRRGAPCIGPSPQAPAGGGLSMLADFDVDPDETARRCPDHLGGPDQDPAGGVGLDR